MVERGTLEAPEDDKRCRAIGWALVAVIALPTAVASTALGKAPSSGYGQTASLLTLGACVAMAGRSQALSKLRSFAVVWIAYFVADVAMHRALIAAGFIEWTERTPKYQWVAIVSTLILLPTLAMVITARAMAFSRSGLRLVVGDVRAAGSIPWSSRHLPWMAIGPASIAVVIASGTIVAVTTSPAQADLEEVLAWLPVGIVFAAVNAFQEELRFRLVPLATLVPAVGADSALWMTSAIFGLAHWSGANPSGPVGFAFAALGGAWLAKSILDTDGVAWSWLIHATSNMALFAFLVLTAS